LGDGRLEWRRDRHGCKRRRCWRRVSYCDRLPFGWRCVAIQEEFRAIAARFVDADRDPEKKAENLALLRRTGQVAGR